MLTRIASSCFGRLTREERLTLAGLPKAARLPFAGYPQPGHVGVQAPPDSPEVAALKRKASAWYSAISPWNEWRRKGRETMIEHCGPFSISQSFGAYRPVTESQAAALRAALNFAASSAWCLTLGGDPGVGKTHLAKALAWKVSKYLAIPTFLTEPEMESLWRRYHDNQFLPREDRDYDLESADELVAHWGGEGCPFLAVDDLGIVPPSRAAWLSVVDRVIHMRESKKLKTVITTNLSSGDLAAKYGARVASRIAAGWCVGVKGEDHRTKVGKIF